MKLIGAAMIILSCSYMGFAFSEREISVLREMERAKLLFENIILELKNERLTIGEIFDKITEKSDAITGKFLQSIRFSGNENIEKSAYKSGFSLEGEIIGIVSGAFSVLGKYSAEQQIEKLENSIMMIDSLRNKKEKNIREKAKLFRYSGFFAGAFIAVMFI